MKLKQLPKRMPHLTGAKEKLEPYGTSRLCVHESAGFVLDVPGAELVFGTFSPASDEERARTPNASRVPFIHAWVEWQGLVWSPTAMGITTPELYYATNGATDIKRLSRPALLKIAKEIGLSRHLRLGVPTRNGESVGATLLNAAGKAFQVEGHTLLPPQETP